MRFLLVLVGKIGGNVEKVAAVLGATADRGNTAQAAMQNQIGACRGFLSYT